ncbi:receptor-type tyrosine-protein phosphatase H [Tenrec ecaudatus]|uniref:receptor-type tyrosine-protein phosphatase H n=1 Tax=Tenrec ecaudatus TaxID=94439 RepID=UPI003F59E3BA
MSVARGGLQAWGTLVLLGLCVWTGARAAEPDPVQNITIVGQTSSSITLTWTAPPASNQTNYTYWVHWQSGDGINGNQSTSDTSITVHALNAGTLYNFTVWVQENGSYTPNPVSNLRVHHRTNSTITWTWIKPEAQYPQNYTYWVQWVSENNTNRTSTPDTSITLEGLEAGTLYTFTVWAELNNVNSTTETVEASTVPNPVSNLTMHHRTNSTITWTWIKPEGPDKPPYTYWVQWTSENNTNINTVTPDTNFTLEGLEAGTLYTFTVWAERNNVNSTTETVEASTVPNPVSNLTMHHRTNSTITWTWIKPEGPDKPPYTYWVQWTSENNANINRVTPDTNFTLEGLEAGTLYTFTVWAERNNVNSTTEMVETSTVPNPVSNLTMHHRTNSTITWTWIKPEGPDKPPYTYWVQWTSENNANINTVTPDTNFTLEGLEAGTLYTFTVWAERNNVNSTTEMVETSTVPNPVSSLKGQHRTNSSITLTWTQPEGPVQAPYIYWVQWMPEDNIAGIKNTANTSITLEGLQAGTLYNFTVWAGRNDVNSTTEMIVEPTVPNSVTSITMQNRTNSSITLSWTAPLGPVQPAHTYWIQCLRQDGIPSTQHTRDTRVTVEGLHAGIEYIFTLWAERNRVNSENRTLAEATAPNEVTDLHNTTQTNDSVRLSWKAPTDISSQSYVYGIRWADGKQLQRENEPQRDTSNQTGKTSDTWYLVTALTPGTRYKFSVWAEMNNVSSAIQSLQASTAPDPVTITSCVSTSGGYGLSLTWPCPNGGYKCFHLTVDGQVFLNSNSCGSPVPLSGFQPARSYLATVTAVWDGIRAPSTSVTCYTESAGVIIGAIVGVLLLLILVGLLVFFLRKRNKKSQEKSDLAFGFPGDIRAEDFADHVRKNEKDSHYGFAEEYQQLTLEGFNQPNKVASAPENNGKNRYRNVLPYDWSRVPLKLLHGEPGSDYINASFMPGLWSSQDFIAAQGPLPQTVGDFWRLVWEQQSHTLVMLTNCIESGRVKCEHYWPLDSQTCTHGQLQVTLVGEEVSENWTTRDLKLFHLEEQKSLAVRQFHYVAWPDHGVPHSPAPLLAFWKVLRKWIDQQLWGGPPIVHCSAGVGRTGTLIALDVLIRQLESEGAVGPFNFVKKMRHSRPLMVQTEAQYVFLHQCILCFLRQAGEKEVTYENVTKNLLYENVAAIQAHSLEASSA